jgi:hypothetical protein
MQISAQTNQQPIARAKAAPQGCPCPENKPTGEQFTQSTNEDPGLMPKPPQNNKDRNYIAEGALYGGLAGAGVAAALGAATFGVGIITGFATIPGGIALGVLGGAIAELLKD